MSAADSWNITLSSSFRHLFILGKQKVSAHVARGKKNIYILQQKRFLVLTRRSGVRPSLIGSAAAGLSLGFQFTQGSFPFLPWAAAFPKEDFRQPWGTIWTLLNLPRVSGQAGQIYTLLGGNRAGSIWNLYGRPFFQFESWEVSPLSNVPQVDYNQIIAVDILISQSYKN